MRSRIAITALLTTGALMSSGGAALGVSALSTTRDAGQAQYGPVTTHTESTPTENLPPRSETLAGSAGPAAPRSGTKNATAESAPTAQAQPARQLESGGGDELPFTGYAAIPLLLAGLTLLVSGLVLRRRTGRQVT